MTSPVDDRIAFLEHHVEQIDEVVRDLFARLEAIERDVTRLRSETERAFAERDAAAETEDDD